MKNQTDFLTKPLMALGIWAAYHLVVWTLLPLLSHACLPLDSVEAVLWGSQWEWGYDKHPPLSAWVAELFSDLFGDGGIYFVSQLCIVTAGLGIYKLGRLFRLSTRQAVLSVILIDTIFFYQYGSVEFNVNILQLPFWAWGWYFGINAVQNKRFLSWVGLGACVALGALTKYIAVFLLIPLFAAWWKRGELLTALRSPGLYVAGLTAMLLFLPHFLWMIDHEWITITYGVSRGSEDEILWWHHLSNPLAFIFGQGAILLPVLIPALLCGRKNGKSTESFPGTFCMAMGAYIALAIFSMATGMAPVTMWAVPLPLAIGLWLVPRFGMDQNPKIPLAFILSLSLVYVVAYGIVYGAGPLIREKPHRISYPGPEIAEQIEARWAARTDQPFNYIVADEFLGGLVNHYGEAEPAVMIRGQLIRSTYLTEEQVQQNGAIVLWLKAREVDKERQWPLAAKFADLEQRYPQLERLPDMIIPWPKRTDGKVGRYGVAYIPPGVPHE
jgi:4-amino-4-deoxy-L-arabinose transferase-like glycosyltransferase